MMTLANQQPAVAKDEASNDVDRPSVCRFHRDLEPKRVYDEIEIVGALAGNRTPTLRSEEGCNDCYQLLRDNASLIFKRFSPVTPLTKAQISQLTSKEGAPYEVDI